MIPREMVSGAWLLLPVLVLVGLVPGRSDAQAMSTFCRFTAGPRAGQIQDFAPQLPAALGTPCRDGQGSTGVVVAPPLSGQNAPPIGGGQGAPPPIFLPPSQPAPAPPGGGPIGGGAVADAIVVRVFYGTDRARAGSTPATFYGAGRGQAIQVGFADVSIPRDHRMGHIERPSIWRFQFREDRSRHVVLVGLNEVPLDQFNSELRAHVQKTPGRAAFVFIHGYNVTFHDAALRTGQMAYDLGFDVGAPILYSWPSQGKEVAYAVDETNVDWTVPHLEAFLANVAAQSGAANIHVIAHSMGNRAIVGALRRLTGGSRRLPLREIVLTAPDIDAEIFRSDIVPEIRRLGGRVTLYASSNDKALQLSKKFHGYQRAGDSTPAIVVAEGLDTVDASAVDTSFVGHSYYGDNRAVLSDLFYLLRNGAPPRFGLQRRVGPQGAYWTFRP